MDKVKIRKIKSIMCINIKWEKYINKRKCTQCYNCQRFGHVAVKCKVTMRCMYCAHEHDTKDCPIKLDKGKRKSVNCGENTHPAIGNARNMNCTSKRSSSSSSKELTTAPPSSRHRGDQPRRHQLLRRTTTLPYPE